MTRVQQKPSTDKRVQTIDGTGTPGGGVVPGLTCRRSGGCFSFSCLGQTLERASRARSPGVQGLRGQKTFLFFCFLIFFYFRNECIVCKHCTLLKAHMPISGELCQYFGIFMNVNNAKVFENYECIVWETTLRSWPGDILNRLCIN